METSPNNDEPLFTPSQIATMAVEPIEPFLQLITSYLITTWGLLTNPRAVIVSIFNPPLQARKLGPQSLSNRLKFWLLAPWSEKKQVWRGWFKATSNRPYPNSWSYLRTTVAIFFFISLTVSSLSYIFPSTIKKVDIIAEHRKTMKEAQKSTEYLLRRPFTRDEQVAFGKESARQEVALTAEKELRDNASIKQPAMLVVAFMLCYSLAKLMSWRHKLPMRELLAVSRYGTALGLLAYVVGQLLTDIPAGHFAMAGNTLFLAGLVIIPGYYIAWYVKKQRPAISLWLNAGILIICQGVLFFGAWQAYLYFGVRAMAFLQHVHDTH